MRQPTHTERRDYLRNKTLLKVNLSGGTCPKGSIVFLARDDMTPAPWFQAQTDPNGNLRCIGWNKLEVVDEASHVDDVYASLSEGQRVHLLNKLAKHGYDHRTGASIVKRLSVAQKLKVKEILATFKAPVKTYSRGDTVTREGNPYIIAQVSSNEVILLNPIHGTRWNEKVKVGNPHSITQKEFDQLL